MSAKSAKNNNVIYSIPARATRLPGPEMKPSNAYQGGTAGNTYNVYGQGRGGPAMGSYSQAQLMQWRAGKGTTQDRYNKTRLPGDY